MKHRTAELDSGFVAEEIDAIRRERPLIHCITNTVSMNLVANTLLAAGASPVMASAVEEVEEIVPRAAALLLNTGTITAAAAGAMHLAASVAAAGGIPIVLDPVGAAASTFRRRVISGLLEQVSPAVIRGNASEILALSGMVTGCGVDSVHRTEEALEAARTLAGELKCVVVVSGEVDYVLSEDRWLSVSNGHPLMSRVTGMGCAASGLIAAFAATSPEKAGAAAAAMAATGVAGELASARADGPGTFQALFLDNLFRMNAELLEGRPHIRILTRE